MAKKGGVQQLQAEINNDDDLEKFMDRYSNALIVLDVYSEWCGPCLGPVNALRKIKLELGGDKLQMAICKSDYITKLRRFRKRSEPTWLFIRDNRSVNLMFGSHVPNLMSLIKRELELVEVPLSKRVHIDIEELHPEEQRRERIKNNAIQAIEQKERFEREKKRFDYLMYCTNSIMENLPEVGVSIFGTHVPRDMFKKISAAAETLKIQCKDRVFQTITKKDFETANFVCGNPLPEDVMDQMAENSVLICFWKISDESGYPVPYVMNQLVHELTKKIVEPPDEFNPEERVTPPVIEPVKIKYEYEVDEDVVCPYYEDDTQKDTHDSAVAEPTENELFVDEEMVEEEENEQEAVPTMGDMPAFDIGGPEIMSEEAVEEEEDVKSLPPPPKKMCTKIIDMPAVWVPNDERSHAALIYVFFRNQTLQFLMPDPPPEPPHVIMAFDTYKKRDLVSLAERYKNDIPMYGFFTSDDADEAKFIANSTQAYMQRQSSPEDKLVFKVNKHTSHMMLNLVTYGATYVSPNPIVGKEEALKFFPPDYRTAEDDRIAASEAEGGKKGEQPKRMKEAENEENIPSQAENTEMTAVMDSERMDGEGTEGAKTDGEITEQ